MLACRHPCQIDHLAAQNCAHSSKVAVGAAPSLAGQLIQHGAAADKKKLAARADVGERVLGGLRSWSVVGCLCTWYR